MTHSKHEPIVQAMNVSRHVVAVCVCEKDWKVRYRDHNPVRTMFEREFAVQIIKFRKLPSDIKRLRVRLHCSWVMVCVCVCVLMLVCIDNSINFGLFVLLGGQF
jgi:hypothetical protein